MNNYADKSEKINERMNDRNNEPPNTADIKYTVLVGFLYLIHNLSQDLVSPLRAISLSNCSQKLTSLVHSIWKFF